MSRFIANVAVLVLSLITVSSPGFAGSKADDNAIEMTTRKIYVSDPPLEEVIEGGTVTFVTTLNKKSGKFVVYGQNNLPVAFGDMNRDDLAKVLDGLREAENVKRRESLNK